MPDRTSPTTRTEASALHAAVETRLAAWADEVVDLARDLHAHPELAFEETRSAAAICAVLAEGGLEVEHGTGGLPTAFTATAGSGPLVVALCAEYDALPGLGHACGHNLIAGAAVAAALTLAPMVDDLGITLKAIGTPAEEHGGGKIHLLHAGAFDGVAVALMAHPVQDGLSHNPAGMTAQAVGRFRATFSGRASHAAAAPHLALNAADAATLSQVAIGLLRQQVPDGHRIASYIAEAGEVTNIIAERAVVEFECRAFSLPEYDDLLRRVRRCFDGAALATGTTVVIDATEPLYEPLVQDDDLAAHWATAMADLGKDTSPAPGMSGGSTDMGNISQVIASLHPWVSVPGADVGIHSRDFAAIADTDGAYAVMLDAARALAHTVVGAATTPDQRERFLAAAHRGSSRAPA